MISKGTKFRIYPTKKQEQQFIKTLGCKRFLWNNFLAKNINLHERTGKFRFYYDMSKKLTQYKKKKTFLKEIEAQILQQTLKDLEQAMKKCFKEGTGFPKFKKKHDPDESFRCTNQKVKICQNSIYIVKIGNVRTIFHTEVDPISVKNLTVSKDGNHWYASLCCEFKPKKLPKTGKEVGLDLGTVRLATTNKGKVIKSLDLSELDRRIRTKQRELARRTKGSRNWLKTKATLRKLYKKQRDIRKDYLDKKSIMLVRKYDIIVVENLEAQKMTKSNKGTKKKPGKNVAYKSKLNKSILEQGWRIFINMLEYKTRWYGKTLIKVDPAYTSQACSYCGFISYKNRLSQSNFKCINCNLEMNADHNAAKNILTWGKLAA